MITLTSFLEQAPTLNGPDPSTHRDHALCVHPYAPGQYLQLPLHYLTVGQKTALMTESVITVANKRHDLSLIIKDLKAEVLQAKSR